MAETWPMTGLDLQMFIAYRLGEGDTVDQAYDAAARKIQSASPPPSGLPGREAIARVITERIGIDGDADDHHKFGLRIADAILALFENPDGWRTIESAPKDGTHILVTDGDMQTVAHWFDAGEERGFYLSWNLFEENSDYGMDTITHWRPLPDPPRPKAFDAVIRPFPAPPSNPIRGWDAPTRHGAGSKRGDGTYRSDD